MKTLFIVPDPRGEAQRMVQRLREDECDGWSYLLHETDGVYSIACFDENGNQLPDFPAEYVQEQP